MKTRSATLDDLPAVVKVILAAINKERLWKNFVPAKTGQDSDYLHQIEKLLKEHLDPNNKAWDIQVVDIATKNESPRIVSVAIWDLSQSGADDKKPREVKTDISDSRLSAYLGVVSQARSERFARYHQHRYLQLLATHPDHQNQGYAKDLVQAAIQAAKQKGGVLTTLGGPFGYIFFSGLGFHDLGLVTLPPSTATDAQNIKALSLEVNKEERRASIVDSVLNYISG